MQTKRPAILINRVAGAHVEHADGDGNTALLLSIDKRASIDLVTVLVQHGAAVNTRNFAGRSAPTAATRRCGELPRADDTEVHKFRAPGRKRNQLNLSSMQPL